MKKNRKINYANWCFFVSNNIFCACNIHYTRIQFESTTKSGLMRKLNNYRKTWAQRS